MRQYQVLAYYCFDAADYIDAVGHLHRAFGAHRDECRELPPMAGERDRDREAFVTICDVPVEDITEPSI